MAGWTCVAGRACVAGETASATDGMHPTGMHSCIWISFNEGLDSLTSSVQMTFLFGKSFVFLKF